MVEHATRRLSRRLAVVQFLGSRRSISVAQSGAFKYRGMRGLCPIFLSRTSRQKSLTARPAQEWERRDGMLRKQKWVMLIGLKRAEVLSAFSEVLPEPPQIAARSAPTLTIHSSPRSRPRPTRRGVRRHKRGSASRASHRRAITAAAGCAEQSTCPNSR
jgi:hypothetical protein